MPGTTPNAVLREVRLFDLARLFAFLLSRSLFPYSGVPTECQPFCKGDVPTCDMQSIFSYQPCLSHMRSIIDCQKEASFFSFLTLLQGLGPQPRYDRDWIAECDWEGR